MTTTTEAFLHAHGIRVQPDTLDRFLAEAIARLPKALYRSDPRSDLTVGEVETLEKGGFDLASEDLGEDDPLARTAAEFAAFLKTSLTETEAAQRLGVEPQQLREHLEAQPPRLFGVRLDGGWRIAEFQFDGDTLLPGLAEVIAEVDRELHPIAVYRWFTLPSPDLVVEGEDDRPMSPREWLRLGRPVPDVVELAKHL